MAQVTSDKMNEGTDPRAQKPISRVRVVGEKQEGFDHRVNSHQLTNMVT